MWPTQVVPLYYMNTNTLNVICYHKINTEIYLRILNGSPLGKYLSLNTTSLCFDINCYKIVVSGGKRKNSVFLHLYVKILYFKKIIRISYLMCKRPRCYHSASKTQVAERIFKLTPVHATVIYQILWIRWIPWISYPLREYSIFCSGSNCSLFRCTCASQVGGEVTFCSVILFCQWLIITGFDGILFTSFSRFSFLCLSYLEAVLSWCIPITLFMSIMHKNMQQMQQIIYKLQINVH